MPKMHAASCITSIAANIAAKSTRYFDTAPLAGSEVFHSLHRVALGRADWLRLYDVESYEPWDDEPSSNVCCGAAASWLPFDISSAITFGAREELAASIEIPSPDLPQLVVLFTSNAHIWYALCGALIVNVASGLASVLLACADDSTLNAAVWKIAHGEIQRRLFTTSERLTERDQLSTGRQALAIVLDYF
eukprot:6206988-Amphidinium_carterae.1